MCRPAAVSSPTRCLALEYEETRNKARALFTAIELAQGQEEWE